MCLLITGPSQSIRSTLLHTPRLLEDIYASNADGCWLMTEGDSSVYAVDLSTVQALLITADQLKTE